MHPAEDTVGGAAVGTGSRQAQLNAVYKSQLAFAAIFAALLLFRVFRPREHWLCQIANATRIGLQRCGIWHGSRDFLLGYVMFEVPSNLMLEKRRANHYPHHDFVGHHFHVHAVSRTAQPRLCVALYAGRV